MALTVISKGATKSEVVWSGSCRQCNSVCECVGSDITKETFDSREGGSFSWEKCPVCGAGASGSNYGGLLMYPNK